MLRILSVMLPACLLIALSPFVVLGEPPEQDETARRKSQLLPLVEAMSADDQPKIAALLQKLQADKDRVTAEVARRLVASAKKKRPHISPLYVPKEIREVPLSDCQPETAHVGEGDPVYDRIPKAEGLLEVRGRIYRHGIWAHSPAQHTYDLGGAWKDFSGRVGVAGPGSGHAVFVINADGKELWRSPKTKQGEQRDYWVDVTNVARLELVVEDGGDGSDDDWAIWIEPILGR